MGVRLVLQKEKSQTKPKKKKKKMHAWCLIPDRPVERYVFRTQLLVLLGCSLGLPLSITLMWTELPLSGYHRVQSGTGGSREAGVQRAWASVSSSPGWCCPSPKDSVQLTGCWLPLCSSSSQLQPLCLLSRVPLNPWPSSSDCLSMLPARMGL